MNVNVRFFLCGEKAATHVCMYGYPIGIAMRELDTLLANNRIRLK